MHVYESLEELIGKTPLLHLNALKRECRFGAELYAKLESRNPGGSAKDRVALAMIRRAEQDGTLQKGGTIIEPTSGNTGIGLASLGAAAGYRVIITMPDTMSKERQTLMLAYGAELVLTPGNEGMAGAIRRAEELQKTIPGSIVAGQFVNPANPEAHRLSTGPEIWEDTDGNVDIIVCGVGTGGTITGIGEYLKERKPSVKVIAVEPDTSAVLSGGCAGAHGLQGIGAGFIPDILNTQLLDEIMTVSTEQAYDAARKLAKSEGILCGISGGAALHASLITAQKAENAGKHIVVLLPDGGERYLSTDLYAQN